MSTFSQIPANIITGFLGVGKTTAIQYLLKNKPEHERWAVLVNEFGEVGIDAGLMSNESAGSGVFMKEVPGGCMCCTAGLPMQIALNQLIRQAKPDRLLIEPTGLGHPREVISSLLQPEYREVLDLRSTITLVDARKLSDSRYTEHETFNQQILVADLVVAHKADLYQADERSLLQGYLAKLGTDATLYSAANGELKTDWLELSSKHRQAVDSTHSHHHGHSISEPEPETLPESGYLRRDNRGEGYHSSGWIFSPEYEFSYVGLEAVLNGLEVERLKAVFITDEGIFAYNLADGVMKVMPLDEVWESRIEVIGEDPLHWLNLEEQLLINSVRL